MHQQIINLSQTGIVVCLFVIVGYAAVDLVPCDKSRRVFTDSWGVITDGPVGSNYTQDSHCEWLIKANSTNKYITLSFRSMGTECSYDYVFVYDGDSFRSPLLGSFSGKTEPQQVTATSGYMLILLYSDTNYVLDGFRAEFSITDCPNNCSGNGICFMDKKNKCFCNNDWGGFDCSKKLCPDDCNVARGLGVCQSGKCVCNRGYSGQSCSLPDYDDVGNRWHWLSHSESGLTARAAHTAVYVKATDSLYVFGGTNLNNVLGNLEIYSFLNSTWHDEYGRILVDNNVFHAIDPASVPRLFAQAGTHWQEKWGLKQGHSFLKNLLYAAGDNGTFTKRKQRHSQRPDRYNRPAPRYGHAACNVRDGFVVYGGKVENGSLSNELWLYDVYRNAWELRARSSTIEPPPLTRHSLTTGNEDDVLYLFGGSTTDGEFSSRLFKIELQDDGLEEWQEIRARGGKELDVRVVAHSTVYHAATNSLLVYGGIVAGVARFSKLSDRMFAFQLDERHWTEIHYTREHLRDRYVPRERAFHTANILGNYLIVFGGYSHRHNKEEICYDNQMYLYHLGCHTWVNPEILGKTTDHSRYPKQQGVFAHAACVRNSNTLTLVGGYHGNVNGDLLAYTVPPTIASTDRVVYDPEKACPRHKTNSECLADPECGYCSVDGLCYGRTVGANCTTNLQATRCPGICPALADCHSCLIHGGGEQRTGKTPLKSAAIKLGLVECTWCVQNARCHHKDDNYGVCGLREDSPSRMPGWWGAKGTEVVRADRCRELDRRPGLTFIRYHHPVNFSQPDHVMIINATTVDYSNPINMILKPEQYNGKMVARLMGFLRPPSDWQEMLKVCVSFCNATLKIDGKLLSNITAEQRECQPQRWIDAASSNASSSSSSRVSVDFESQKYVTIGGFNSHLSKMELQHHREKETPKVFTFEYLEPYANGTCEQYRNCLHCLTDSQCGWCELTNLCVSRVEDEQFTCVDTTNTTGSSDWRYLTLQPSACSNCSNYISCESCVETGLCEWRVDEAKCSRIGLSPESAISPHQCPTPCYQRTNCSACLEQQRGRCVWCEATQQCFSFSVYTSEYQFGLCREWLDQVPSFVPSIASSQDTPMAPRPQEQCKSCSLHANCSSCLSSLSCGWCYNSSNPISGVCVQGDFNNPHVNCSEALGGGVTNARWAYAQCPDVDECGLGIDDCHADAICINTDGSFSCHCRRGYKGDGRHYCDRTCYNDCVHGICSDKPLYTCNCDLGWTGDDCSINCGCNNHSACTKGVGKCDECQNWTTGEHCEFCQSGSYGNATTHEGCHPCQCNGHGNAEQGECHNVTGICYCIDNTEGNQCERCKPNYIGNPTNGKKCYYQCEARGVLYDTHGQGISSVQEYSTKWSGTPTRECLWIINPATEKGSPVIQFEIIPSEFKVTCGDNAVYVYDGLPDIGSQSTLAAVFCDSEPSPSTVIESRSGQLTVHYKKGFSKDQGFNASYTVLSCDNCPPSRKCRDDVCVCNDGFVGTRCDEAICPQNCSGRGTCDLSYGRCHCPEGWGGVACDIRLKNDSQLIFTELFNTLHLTESLEHLRKTLPRFGHSLSADRRGSLWMFGGYSLSHGPLNDIRLFDTRNTTWMQVTVDSTPEARMPQGRYFHGADIVHSRQAIYVYGGLTRTSTSIVTFDSNNRTLDDFWQFDIQNQRWREIERDSGKTNEWPPSVAGHTLTSYRNASVESLILVGGMAPPYGFLNVVWEYRLDVERWERWRTRGKGPTDVVGHSAVFHQPTNSLYVFGGIVRGERITNKLYALNYDTRTWTDMNVFMPSESDIILPKPRFFHSAVTTDSYMVIFGGRLEMANSTEILYAYSYNCNQWINLLNETDWIGPLPRKTYAQAMTIDADGSAVYVIGGWTGDTKCNVYKIQIPKNLCSLWPNRLCLTVPDCAYCAIKLDDEIKKETCYGIAQECPLEDVVNYTKNTNQARTCTGQLLANCRDLQDCSTCLQVSECQWCNDTCTSNKTCQSYTSTTSSLECSLDLCPATDCIQCHQMEGCTWTGELCVPVAEMRADRTEIATCNLTCAHFTTCSSCLNDKIDCRWSTQLNECFDPAYVPILYVGGVSGLVLNPREKQHCPEPCDSFDQCSTCLKHFHCGWCSVPSSNGQGLCTDGSNDRPLSGSCERVMANRRNIINLNDEIAAASNNTYSWYYVKCPPEDECSNDHHNCARNSEVCVDLEEGFECVCGPGYKAGSTGCEPVCSQGCVRGQCVEPDKCQCDFGYVGANCSIQCQCNGHANCEGPDRLDQCLTCHNNTMGAQCEKCKPLYVGDPSNGGQCVPCLEYCNGHTDVCVGGNVTESDLPEDFEELAEFFKEGPKDSARCIRCGNRTTGIRCDDCITGNFRGFEDHRKACRPCDCHGHGDTCDPVTGEKCNCKNNTESDSCPSGSSKNSAQQCWMVQCSKCKEGYLGTPKAGHQCYKQLNMDAKMCFDAKPIDECKIKPRPLHPGETVFFAIQPRFMNVDIRIMIDVTQGKLNVYMSQHDDTYVVYPNASTGFQQIDLDSKYGQFENGSYKTDDVLLERDAEGLRTYITVTQPKTMLAVKGLSDRLVITLPEEYHCLDTNRFYIVLQALEPEDTDKKVAYGIIFFRQDQLHIDLFVFFSVFFSCFFLFLAACVVAWKAKQAADVRRARRRHVVEMLHMAKRPFASVTLNLSTRPKPRTRSIHHDLRPVAVEPTDDGLAAVATIFVSLPGGQNTTVKLALASSLILLARQYPSGSRAFLRRRSMPLPPPT